MIPQAEKVLSLVNEIEAAKSIDLEQRALDIEDLAPASRNFIRQPYLDEAGLTRKQPPVWPEDAEFAVCLSHDLDLVARYHPAQAMRKSGLAFHSFFRHRQKKFLGQTLDGLREFLVTGWKKDPVQKLERWAELEARHNVRSTFFIPPERSERRHWTDCLYHYDDRVLYKGRPSSVRAILRDLAKGEWEIGLHPSWWSFRDAALMTHQRDQVADAVGAEIESVRQHFLHFDPARTPAVHAAAGLRYDSTLGFNNEIGFRQGTSYPWRLPAGVLEIPLHVQDVAMFNPKKGLRLDVDTAIEETLAIARRVQAVRGVLTLSWHPDMVANPVVFSMYGTILEELRRWPAWFGTMREIGHYWESKVEPMSTDEQGDSR